MNPHAEAYETSKVAVPSLRSERWLVDSEGIEPSSPGCKPGILRAVRNESGRPSSIAIAARSLGPLNDEPILARTTGLEPVLPR